MPTRHLTVDEIAVMERHGCRAEDWRRVLVAEGFVPGESYYRVRFSGDVVLGRCRGTLRDAEGIAFPAGIEHASLHNVSVGDDCVIRRADIADADIGDGVLLDDVSSLSRQGDAPFANDSAAHVLAEDGARSVPLWRDLSAQTAHVLCHMKGHAAADALEALIRRDAESLRLKRSVVSSGCRVRRCGTLRNVWLGEGAIVDGAALLDGCCVDSSPEAPARVGEGVSARECVFQRGSATSGGVRLGHCLVGEGVRLEDGFVGKHSLFFANCDFALGEASCAMAGPFAVSSHKATLILTCQCSFSTFGSASNSSNHHFKLGPRHGGVMRRGVRCGSGSYIFWPSDIGAFTTVVGRHAGHLDTVNFPFSLLIGREGKSVLVPGVNLFTAGTYRDAAKWLRRDRRGGVKRVRDLVNPALLSPYTLQAMRTGMDLLKRSSDMGVDLVHGGAVIPAERFKPALRLYESAWVFYLGERLFTRASARRGGGVPDGDDVVATLREALAGGGGDGGRWRDWGGMLLSGDMAEDVAEGLVSGRFGDAGALRDRLEEIHGGYGGHELAWAARHWLERYGEATRENVSVFAVRWRKAVRFRHECLIKDASKEYSAEAMYGFGVECDMAESFRRVRGTVDEHELVAASEKECAGLCRLADGL